MLDTVWLTWSMLFGAAGLGYFVYGRRQKALVPLLCGLALMLFPYLIDNHYALPLVGAGLMALPYFVRI